MHIETLEEETPKSKFDLVFDSFDDVIKASKIKKFLQHKLSYFSPDIQKWVVEL